MSVAQYAFVVALYIHYGYYDIAPVKVEVLEAICFSKSLAPVFELADIMPVPHYAQRVCLAELHFQFRSMM